MIINGTYFPIFRSSGGCCNNEEISGVAIIGILIAGIALIVFLLILIDNITTLKNLRNENRFIGYIISGACIIIGVLMIILDLQSEQVTSTYLNDGETRIKLYIEDGTNLEEVCEKFDIIDIDGNVFTVREK